MTAKEVLKIAVKKLSDAQIEAPRFDALELLCFALKLPKDDLHLHPEMEISKESAERFLALISRRERGYPLQYLLGSWPFYGCDFCVGEGVLIPRPDTETLVDLALETISPLSSPKVLDLCSGSGCIAVAIAKARPDAVVEALEFSGEAFPFLERNIAKNQVTIRAIWGDLFHPRALSLSRYDLIVSNPPYLRTDEMHHLQPEVSFEPKMALAAGEDGLLFYRAIAKLYPTFLKAGGTICVEIGYQQREAVSNLFLQAGFGEIDCRQDLGGNWRAVRAKWPSDGSMGNPAL